MSPIVWYVLFDKNFQDGHGMKILLVSDFFVLCTLNSFNFRCCLHMWLFFFIYISYILCISFRVRKFCMNIGLFHIYFMTTKYGCQKNFWEVGNICLCCLFLINLTKFNSYNQFNLTICIPDNFCYCLLCCHLYISLYCIVHSNR